MRGLEICTAWCTEAQPDAQEVGARVQADIYCCRAPALTDRQKVWWMMYGVFVQRLLNMYILFSLIVVTNGAQCLERIITTSLGNVEWVLYIFLCSFFAMLCLTNWTLFSWSQFYTHWLIQAHAHLRGGGSPRSPAFVSAFVSVSIFGISRLNILVDENISENQNLKTRKLKRKRKQKR